MTDEEAIKRLKNKLENDIEYANRCNPFSDLVHEVILDNKAVERVLNLIEKQDNKIKELEKELKERKSYNKSTKEALRVSEELEKIYNEEASRLETKLEKKDKMIKEMAKVISNFEDYCIDNVCDEGLNNYCKEEKCTNDFTDCIIKYFEKKKE